MEAVDAELLAGRPARAVILPTAAAPEGPERVAHWVARQLARIEPGQSLVGIDEDTVLVGGPDRWQVAGRQRVWVFDHRGERSGHAAGAELELGARLAARLTRPVPCRCSRGSDRSTRG